MWVAAGVQLIPLCVIALIKERDCLKNISTNYIINYIVFHPKTIRNLNFLKVITWLISHLYCTSANQNRMTTVSIKQFTEWLFPAVCELQVCFKGTPSFPKPTSEYFCFSEVYTHVTLHHPKAQANANTRNSLDMVILGNSLDNLSSWERKLAYEQLQATVDTRTTLF